MPRITAEELLERRISELKGTEFEKKKELNEIQKELRKNQKALEVLTGTLPNANRKPKHDV